MTDAAEEPMTDPDDAPAARRARLAALERGTSLAAALAFFDALPPADPAGLAGRWRGSGVPTGHPLDGTLEALGWLGKRFEPTGDAHPLLLAGPRGVVVDLDPRVVRLRLALRCAPLLRRGPVARAVRALLPLAGTRGPRARVRAVVHRGVTTAAMTYDALPVEDAFRAVDDDTLLGLMEARGMDRPYLFVLRRVPAQDTLPCSSRRQ